MKLFRWQIIIILFLLAVSQNIFSYEKQDDGIILKINKRKDTDPRLIKIEVCNDNIIRIIASPVDTFSTRKSLMINKIDWKPVKWSVKEEGNLIKISTANVIATIDSSTGRIAFYNSDNHLLLEEKAGGGKIISPAEVMGEKTNHIRQLFEPS
ncbi:MAG: DUF4968 domain-containing protein, partial [Ignavibacteriaceae bacterium]